MSMTLVTKERQHIVFFKEQPDTLYLAKFGSREVWTDNDCDNCALLEAFVADETDLAYGDWEPSDFDLISEEKVQQLENEWKKIKETKCH